MVLNRLSGCLQPREPPPGAEYYVLLVPKANLMVSRAMAEQVVKQLRRGWGRPRWIRVVDLSGAEIWLPTASIEMVCESTPDQREYDRQLRRQLEAEDNGEASAWG